ncbi:unnamed protein product [Urochloa decumbens]|uniref:F-box domain-containing protein n=1 Tax=Urochloa decumbens TaxID=240449 RepID=A0ABC9C0N3_9POAL
MDTGDRISGLPNELHHHIQSFLPARDAVHTCVLSPKWRHLWASARRLNVDTKGFTSQRSFVKFVSALLLSRDCTPLDSFWLDADGPGIFLENFRETAYQWICHALRSNVEELGIRDHDRDNALDEDGPEAFRLDHCPFTSSCLKRLHLCGVCVDKCFLKNLFSCCPALEDLDMMNCVILATEFSSATLKKLSIGFDRFPELIEYGHTDIVINMPRLVSLHIGALVRAMLSLVDVQSLVTASIYLDTDKITFADGCSIITAPSNVTNLEFMIPYYERKQHSLQSNMQLCQVVFTNLTTLSLSDWCLHDNCKALFYLLEHSPNLEKLTLKMANHRCYAYFDSPCIAADDDSPCQEIASFNCEKLKKIEIFNQKDDKAVGMLVTILLTKISSPPEISIKPSPRYGWVDDLDRWTEYGR